MSSITKPSEDTGKPVVKRGVGRPRQVSLEQIFAAASDIGLGNLTLQAVADTLGVTPQALYHHVKGREDLIAQVVAAVTERFPVQPYTGEGWSSWAVSFAHALLEMYAAVPGLADYTIRRTHTGYNVLIRHEMSIKAARQSGFDEVGALYATRAIVEFVAGWVARSERRNVTERELEIHPDLEFRQSVLDNKDDQYPELKKSLQAAGDLEPSHRFDYTLRALIFGLENNMAISASQQTQARP
ncbi:MAG: TetR/AcrR family transcriptional regulator C-terminal domain-containing protein [Pseudomonadota bacterium]